MKEKVLVVGGGGRGAVVVEGYSRSNHVGETFLIGDNDTIQDLTEKPVKTYPQIRTTDVDSIVSIYKEEKISLVDVTQENAVEAGLTNALIREGAKVIGPTREAGQIEWSKIFGRKVAGRIGLLQPEYFVFECFEDGKEFLDRQEDKRWFVKADGLAEGKGALGARNNREAKRRVEELKRFGRASDKFLLEEWLEGDDGSNGEEFSSFYITDGINVKHLGDAQDHKRVSNFDEGENTGGMGCSSPPLVLKEEISLLNQTNIEAVLEQLRDRDILYKGVIYYGGILVKRGRFLVPYLMEFNARWGDPEAQVIVPGIKNDFFEMGMAVADGDIGDLIVERDEKARVVVAGVARGYPGDYEEVRGREIKGFKEARKIEGVRIYGAGVRKMDEKYYTNGGRIFYVVGEGINVLEAREKAYEAMESFSIEGDGLHFRTDIGWRDVARLRE